MSASAEITRIDHHVLVAGHPLFVREIVSSEPIYDGYLLFVHGNTFPSIADFDLPLPGRSYVEYLADLGINCCIYDGRGYGRSYLPDPKEPNGFAQRAGDLRAIVDFLITQKDVRRVSFFGLSTGCNIIAQFMSEYPSPVVDQVVFSGPCYLLNPKIRRIQRKMQALRWARLLNGCGRDSYVSFDESALRKRLLEGEETHIVHQACEMFIECALKQCGPLSKRLRSPVLGWSEFLNGKKMWDPLFDPTPFTQPMLILRGERDSFCCSRSMDELTKDVPSDDLAVNIVPGINHDMHLYRNPKVVFSAIADFIHSRSLRARSA